MRRQFTYKRQIRALLIALAGFLAISVAAAVHAEPHGKKPKKSAKELHLRLKGVKTRIHEKRVQIRQTKQKERKITHEIAVVEDRLLRTESHLDRTKARLKELSKQQKLLRKRINATDKRLEGRRHVLARRLRENYMRGDPSYLQVLLRSRSVHEYVSRSFYVERIVESDTQLVEGIKLDLRQLAADKRALDSQAEEQTSLKQSLQVEQKQYESDVDKKQDLLHDVRENRQAMEEALDELESASHDIEAQIRALQQTPRGRARMAKAWTGSFMRPAEGSITSGFGMRYHPILHRNRMHTGVDIGAGYGAPIHAAGDGEVILAEYYRGYGNCVIIDHGGSVSTLYGHCSRLHVSVGQMVHKGDVIANVGSTGLATGPHLHFEVRHNGTPVNPL